MSMIEKIESELKEISKWPWKAYQNDEDILSLRMGSALKNPHKCHSHDLFEFDPAVYPR